MKCFRDMRRERGVSKTREGRDTSARVALKEEKGINI